MAMCTAMPTVRSAMAISEVVRHWAWRETWFRRLWHGPHVHGDRPVRLDGCFPDPGKDDLPIWPDQIIVTFRNVGAEIFDM
jgi:hypothetical protein